MRSKVAVVVSLLFILVIGAAALAVNTRILNTPPRSEIGRANEVLVPRSAEPGVTPVPPTASPSIAPSTVPATPRSDDEHSSDEKHEPEDAEHGPDD